MAVCPDRRMTTISVYLRFSATIGAALVLPFVLLELANRRGLPEDFPIPLFGLMWLLSSSVTLILTSLVRSVRARNSVGVSAVGLLLRVACLIPFAWLWVVLVLDQMPCFLGVPNCD